MKKPKPLLILTFSLIIVWSNISLAQNAYNGYVSLDASEPINFNGSTVTWNGKTFKLDEHTIFLDYRLDEQQISNNPYAFNNIQDASKALTSGTEESPMVLLTAPGVYWVDDPDDPEIRVPGPGDFAPIGMKITCDHLYFYGLNAVADNVVFAVNRGQTQGSSGNFTMFSINGKGLKSENVTFGNFCNVDLEFPLAPELSREKRAEAIAQAQLFSYRNRDGVAINTNFISRLNLLPFATTYLNCHLESSGHASFFNSVYIGCTLEFYNVNFSSGRFYDCDIYLTPFLSNYQNRNKYEFGFLDGNRSGLACVDTRFHRSPELVAAGIPAEVSWGRTPHSETTRSYQYNVTLDGKPYVIQEYATPGATVVMKEGSDLLKAYQVSYDGKNYCNVPNILSGDDPFGYMDIIKAAAVADGKPQNYYLSIPMNASLTLDNESSSTIRSTQTKAILKYEVLPNEYAKSEAIGEWTFQTRNPSNAQYVSIVDNKDGTIAVSGSKKSGEAMNVIVVAKNALGIEAAYELTIEPPYLDAPAFSRTPSIKKPKDGMVMLDYALDLEGMTDESIITWYRCKDATCADSLKVSVSRMSKPETSYVLSPGDAGNYLMAIIRPDHARCDPGNPKAVLSTFKVATRDVKVNWIETNFYNLPTDPQPLLIPGTWTLDGYFAPECYDDEISPPKPRYEASTDSWRFVSEPDAEGYFGLEESKRGARLFYQPKGDNFGGMTVEAVFAPKKTSGAGFGSATDQFLDVFIKFDLKTMNGYALRIERLNTQDINELGYDGDGAVAGCAFSLIQYENGKTELLTKKIMSSAFLSESTVRMKAVNGMLDVSVTSTKEDRSGDRYNYLKEVHLKAPIAENKLSGTGMLFTGTVGSNAVRVLRWKTQWE
ncbi:MAG: hypothetical protein ACFHWX_05340 [Bacteroidota bacterium]